MYEGSELLGSELSIGEKEERRESWFRMLDIPQLNINVVLQGGNDMEISFYQTSGFMVRGE